MISGMGSWRAKTLILCGVAAAGLVLAAPQSPAHAAGGWFYDQLNPYTGKWKGRGFGRRKNSDNKEVVSCKGIHKWVRKGAEFEQSYTCWGGDFVVSGAFRLKPAREKGACVGEAMNGAKEVTGKLWGKVMETGELKVNMQKNFSKNVSRATLVPKKDGSIVYTVFSPARNGDKPREILNITYKKMPAKKRK